MIVFLMVLWWVIGSASFIYWWTSEFDLTLSAGMGSVVAGLAGPIAFLIGWAIHGKSGESVVLMKARK